VEAGYSDHPYHNTIHVAEVLRTLHMLMWKGGLANALGLTDVDLLAYYLTAVRGTGLSSSKRRRSSSSIASQGHDFQHGGLSNDFLLQSSDPLALLYNDRSPLENHN
jgi:cAMP-specific phosphodiesterase 4